MGSFIARDYAEKYGDELAGVTICGATGSFRGAAETALLLKIAMDNGLGTDSNP